MTNSYLYSFLDHNPQKTHLTITGISSAEPIGFFLASIKNNHQYIQPIVIIVPDEEAAHYLRRSISFFAPNLKVLFLPEWDVLPHWGLEVSTKIKFERLKLLAKIILNQTSIVYLVTLKSLTQITLPFADFKHNIKIYQKGDPLSLDDIEWFKIIGYKEAPIVENLGQFNSRGHIVDIFSPYYEKPIRIELFGETIESIRFFSTESQTSESENLDVCYIIPASEIIFTDQNINRALNILEKTNLEIFKTSRSDILRSISMKIPFPEIEFLASFFYETPQCALDYFPSSTHLWWFQSNQSYNNYHQFLKELNDIKINPFLFILNIDSIPLELFQDHYFFETITPSQILNQSSSELIHYPFQKINHLFSYKITHSDIFSEQWKSDLIKKITSWFDEDYKICIFSRSENLLIRSKLIFESLNFSVINLPKKENWIEYLKSKSINLLHGDLPNSCLFPYEKIILLSDTIVLGKTSTKSSSENLEKPSKEVSILNFSELKSGDLIVHKLHGIGVFEELKTMTIGDIESEFLQIRYKDNDKLYLPVYKIHLIQKYIGPSDYAILDKIGGSSWQKTKIKVTNHLRDIASELLKLYATRSSIHRDPYLIDDEKIRLFENAFPYEETVDQKKAIEQIYQDLKSPTPMDRLICGDVGFGKTEVAMRAAYAVVASSNKQVALICPTTVLSFQHYETFLKRFAGFNITIQRLNRFISESETKKILNELSQGHIQIIIGTHRLLSPDVKFNNLGLLIIDEEQKFGVTHKEKIRKIKHNVDTLTLSATPIPRTLNFSLMGLRDLSLINTPPSDRLAVRTFVIKWDDSTIRRAIQQEINRGGQIYFVHNRIETIYKLESKLKEILPSTVRIKLAHGKLPEDELELTMIEFFHHKFDVLICTTIIESGMDNPRANTIFIDQPQLMGLSQLYQLRGRVGRSKEKAYCYFLLPTIQNPDPKLEERLKILKDYSELGSGIKIAHYDLELRGAGNILGDEQSGHVSSVGYELYIELLNQTIQELKGNPKESQIDCEINLKIPTLIPDFFISDLRIRLGYYKMIAQIETEEDFERIEKELIDRFGPLPEQVINLMGISLIRKAAENLGAQSLTQGTKNIILNLTEKTPITPNLVIKLISQSNKKYQLLPPNKLTFRINEISWQIVYQELLDLYRLVQIHS